MFPALRAAFSCSRTYQYCPAHRPLRTADQPSGRFDRDGAEVATCALNPEGPAWRTSTAFGGHPCAACGLSLQKSDVSWRVNSETPCGCAGPHRTLRGVLLARALRPVPAVSTWSPGLGPGLPSGSSGCSPHPRSASAPRPRPGQHVPAALRGDNQPDVAPRANALGERPRSRRPPRAPQDTRPVRWALLGAPDSGREGRVLAPSSPGAPCGGAHTGLAPESLGSSAPRSGLRPQPAVP